MRDEMNASDRKKEHKKAMNRLRGRPKLKLYFGKIVINVTQSDMAAIKENALALGLTVSQYCRTMITRYLQKGKGGESQ